MERRKFIGIGGGVIAGAAVGAVGSRYGAGTATGRQLAAIAQGRGLLGDEARGALQTVVPSATYDPYFMFSSSGHAGQVLVIGVPSMHLQPLADEGHAMVPGLQHHGRYLADSRRTDMAPPPGVPVRTGGLTT